MRNIFTLGLISMTLAGCLGGGGGGGGGSGSGSAGFGFLSSLPRADVGETCMGYTMTSAKCSTIGGTWNSTAVPASYTCRNPSWNATSGDCHLSGLKFTAIATPLSQEAIDKCRDFGGQIVPNTQASCESESGTWEISTAATTANSCSKAPADLAECEAVGGNYGFYRTVSGNVSPSAEGISVGRAKIVYQADTSTPDYIENGSYIGQIAGTVKLVGMTDDLWTSAAPVSNPGRFVSEDIGYGPVYLFQLNFSKEYSAEDNAKGLILNLQVYYKN